MAEHFSYSRPSLDAKDYARRRMSRAQERWYTVETKAERNTAGRWAVTWGVIAEIYPHMARLRFHKVTSAR